MVKDFLYAEKKIYDPVHGFIPFDEFEKELIDSLPFQRLHYVHQLGIAYLVYPGATHTRFEHSLGVMELSSRIYDTLLDRHYFLRAFSWRDFSRSAGVMFPRATPFGVAS